MWKLEEHDRTSNSWFPDGKEIQWPKMWTIGELGVLERKRLGLLCSAECPGDVILRAFELAKYLRNQEVALVSGFHSPVEKEILSIVLRGQCQVVYCPARSLERIRLPKEVRDSIVAGRTLALSPFGPSLRRGTTATAQERNALVAALSESLAVVHAAIGGKVHELAIHALEDGKPVGVLNPSLTELVRKGATVISKDFSNLGRSEVR